MKPVLLKVVLLLVGLVTLLLGFGNPWKSAQEISIIRWKEGPLYPISWKEFEKIKHPSITVTYPPLLRSHAIKIISHLLETWISVQNQLNAQLGIELEPANIVLIPLSAKASFAGIKLIGASSDEVLIPWLVPKGSEDVPGLNEGLLLWVLVHEGVEHQVAHLLYHDRQARWVGDGLAEYSAYLTVSTWAPKAAKGSLQARKSQVLNLVSQGYKHYNLLEWFQVHLGPETMEGLQSEVIRAGYGVSWAFWLDLAERHGNSVIKVFWEQLSAQGRRCLIPLSGPWGPALGCHPTAHDAARILSELTGEDIWAKLQRMDLQEVLEVLERAAREIPEG